MRIGTRILLGYLAVVALGALLVAEVFVAQIKPGIRQTSEAALVDTANLLAELATDDFQAGTLAGGRFQQRLRSALAREPVAAVWGIEAGGSPLRIYITDARGIVVFDSTGAAIGEDYSQWNDVYLTLRGRYGARSTAPDPARPDDTVMHVAAPLRDDAGRIIGALTVARPNAAVAPFIARNQATVAAWGVGLLGVALIIGAFTAAWLTRQLGALRRYAQAVAAGERAALPPAKAEFGELGHSLEQMRTQLEGKQYVENYVQALTHEMKSPLAAIRASAELLESPLPTADQARFAQAVGQQADRLARMVDRLLALAALEHRRTLEAAQSVALDEVVDEAATDVATVLDSRALKLDRKQAPGARVLGDAFLLRQAIANLLENAASFSPQGATLELRIERRGALWHIHLRDQGPGVPDYALDRVFERFYSLPRPGGGHRGTGLGLCFVAEVAALHGGRARLENHPDGGAVATLVLPAQV